MILIGGRYKNFGSGTDRPILMSSLQCRGSERSLLECRQQACSVTSCTHNSDVGVVCESKDLFYNFFNYCTLAPCSNGSVRLGDGGVLRGRVEVCYNGSWVTICTHSWTVKEATVICSQLGYSRYGIIMISKSYSINIHVISFRCYCSI